MFSSTTISWIVETQVAIFIFVVLKKTGNLILFNNWLTINNFILFSNWLMINSARFHPPLWGSKDVHSQNHNPYTYQKFFLHNWKRTKDKPKIDFYTCSNLPEWKGTRLISECLTIILCTPYSVRFDRWIPLDRIATWKKTPK